MCLLETLSQVSSSFVGRLPPFLQGSALIVYNQPILIPKVIAVKKYNPLMYLSDVAYVLDKLQIDYNLQSLSMICSLYMANENACPKALNTLGVDRPQYLKICYVISKRLPSYNNYLLRTLMKNAIKTWSLQHSEVVDNLFEDLYHQNNYVETQYLDHINEYIGGKLSRNNMLKKNKIKVFSLNMTRQYVSGFLLSSVGAVNWFHNSNNKVAKAKKNMQNTLMKLGLKARLNEQDFFTYENNIMGAIVEKIYEGDMKAVNKDARDFHRQNRKKMMQERFIRRAAIMQEKATKSYEERVREMHAGDDLIITNIINDYMNGVDLDEEDRYKSACYTIFDRSKCKERYYLHLIAKIQKYYMFTGFRSTYATILNIKRMKLEELGIFPDSIHLGFESLDEILANSSDEDPLQYVFKDEPFYLCFKLTTSIIRLAQDILVEWLTRRSSKDLESMLVSYIATMLFQATCMLHVKFCKELSVVS
jgi:hypothetical protein